MSGATFVFAALVLAAGVAEGEPVPSQEPRRATVREKLLDQPHEFLSRGLEGTARRLDDFFGDPNRTYDSTGSTLQLRGHITFFEGGFRETDTEVRASISLPNTEDRLKLIVQRGLETATQTPAERDIQTATGSTQVTAPAAPQDDRYHLGLKVLAAEAFKVTLSAESGLKLGRSLDPYVRLRAFRDFAFSQWSIRASETPLWRRTEGFSAASEIGALRPLSEEWQLRLTTKATWRSTTRYFDLAQIGSLHYTPDKRTAYTFELGAFSASDRSLGLDVYSITLRARRQIHRDWLYLEITPQTLYREANGLRPEYSLLLQVGALFGDRYLRP